jgi:hypothetical protein
MKASKLQHRVTRTRVNGGKLLEFPRLLPPLWIRRVLVRAQEGQWPVREHRPFSLGLGLRFAPVRADLYFLATTMALNGG